jgi:hypothetical protein
MGSSDNLFVEVIGKQPLPGGTRNKRKQGVLWNHDEWATAGPELP